ncbi:GNAT family N-acetyltransferase [Pseudoalteromonas sp. YIC-827]|uniref:GNAT family N-acetyltransferase n=1 Tax=Pseudoalteromonas qingdaonensis TaxID=3131913 RepID=A0ABU9MUF1_9GAMM
MSIDFRPLSKYDLNYSNVIELYKEAFPGVRRVPSCILRYIMRKGKAGFFVLYQYDSWIGLIYLTEYKDIVFVHFFAISQARRSGGYGSKVMESLKAMYSQKRIVLNIEELNEQAENYLQRLKRKAFYEKNGFVSSGYIVKEPGERLEMMIFGGNVTKEEVQAMYKSLFGRMLGSFIRPDVIEIDKKLAADRC